MPNYADVRLFVFNKYNGRCAYCGVELTKSTFQIDHLIPKKRGCNNLYSKEDHLIVNSMDNFMPSCGSCNSCKSDLCLEDFRGRLYGRVEMLNKYSSEYNIAKRFGLIKETKTIISFYFETFI